MTKKIYYPLEENYEIISKLFGCSFLRDIQNDNLNVEDCIKANEILSKYLYGEEIANLLKNEDIKTINNIVLELKKQYNYKSSILKNIDFNSLGMLVVRPENIGIVENYEKFLKGKGLSVIYKKKINITFEQYLLLYHHGLIPKESRYDFPTRTLNYINKDCYLLFVYSNCLQLTPVSDYLTLLKGKQGKNQTGTLRGDIAYNELKKYVEANGINFKQKEHNVLFDPIGMCRLLVREKIDSDLSHNISDLKLLYYVGQAVHVPNSTEIFDDFKVLCNDNDIDFLEQKIKKLKK